MINLRYIGTLPTCTYKRINRIYIESCQLNSFLENKPEEFWLYPKFFVLNLIEVLFTEGDYITTSIIRSDARYKMVEDRLGSGRNRISKYLDSLSKHKLFGLYYLKRIGHTLRGKGVYIKEGLYDEVKFEIPYLVDFESNDEEIIKKKLGSYVKKE